MKFVYCGLWYGLGSGGWQGPKAVIEASIGKDFLKVPQLVSSGNCSPETQHSDFLTPIMPHQLPTFL